MEKNSIPGNIERRWTLAARNSGGVGATPAADAQWNYADRRTRMERRILYDRRQMIRFEGDRRACDQRRQGVDPWAFP